MGCDIQSGKLFDDCRDTMSGVKTAFFFRHSLIHNITKNASGEITYFGNGTLFRFEQDHDHGMAVQEIQKPDDGSQFLLFKISLNLIYLTPEYYTTINYLKKGRWAIFYLDYEDKIRLMGEVTAMEPMEGVSESGKTAGEKFYTTLSFHGIGDNYAPYLEQFTDYPFDNFPVNMVPPYVPSLNKILWGSPGDHIAIDNFGNDLIHG
jgi:hypothetical protein